VRGSLGLGTPPAVENQNLAPLRLPPDGRRKMRWYDELSVVITVPATSNWENT